MENGEVGEKTEENGATAEGVVNEDEVAETTDKKAEKPTKESKKKNKSKDKS